MSRVERSEALGFELGTELGKLTLRGWGRQLLRELQCLARWLPIRPGAGAGHVFLAVVKPMKIAATALRALCAT